MYIRFECPQGHRLKAPPIMRGLQAHCPACQTQVTVPFYRPNPITDSGVVRLLEECQPPPPVEPSEAPAKKTCPRCNELLSASARICGHCNLYLTISEGMWNRVLNSAMKQVRLRRRLVK